MSTVRASVLLIMMIAVVDPLAAAPPGATESEALQATGSLAARRNAIQSIPFEKLDEASRAKVNQVLSATTVFRRLPIRMVSCDPDLYQFLAYHPDVVVNIWQVLGIAQLELRQTGPNSFRVVETEGTAANIEFLYHSGDTHIVYADWTYASSLLGRRVSGRCLAVFKSGFVRETDGRCYVTSRLDGFLSVEPGGVEMLTKALHPFVVKNADTTFVQTISFIGSLSHTAELNPAGMKRLASKLTHVQPEVREQFSDLIVDVAERSAASSARETAPEPAVLAARPDSTLRR